MADITRLQRKALMRPNCNRGELGDMNRKQTDRLVRPFRGKRQL